MTPIDGTPAPEEKATPTIPAVQALRALAACMVLVFHTEYMLNTLAGYDIPSSNTGAAGVDIFFVISGFIMAYITRHGRGSPIDFLRRRLIRIGPPYWFYTTVTLAILVFIPGAFAHLRLDWSHVAFSYCFLLSNNNEHVVGTVLGVGWTVCFEAYFYLLCAVSMKLSPRGRTMAIGGVILAGAVLGSVIAGPPFSQVFLSTLPLEFLAGYLFGRAYVKGMSFPVAPAVLAVVAASALIGVAGWADVVTSERDLWRVLYFGVPAAVLVAGTVSIDARRPIPWAKPILHIGDASYSLYLSHQFVLYAVGKLWLLVALQLRLPAVALFAVAILACLLAAHLSYRLLERPVTRVLNGRRSRTERAPQRSVFIAQ